MTEADQINASTPETVPDQTPVVWSVAMLVSWRDLRRRFLRSLITMAGVILAIAFLAYVLTTESITQALVHVDDDQLNLLLQENGIDIYAPAGTDEMMLMLIVLSLFICLVGIVNAMLMAVAERVKEIGTLKCLGAMDSFIVKIFFIESSLQGIMGTLIGMVLGLIVALLIAAVKYPGYALNPDYLPVLGVTQGLVITVLVGAALSIAASIAPAYFAAKKQPVEAMRVEE